MKTILTYALCAFSSVVVAAGDMVSSAWSHGVSHSASAAGSASDDVPSSGGAFPNSTLSLVDLAPPNSVTSNLLGAASFVRHTFSITANGGEPGPIADAGQSFWFMVDAPMTFEVSGSMSASAGYGLFRWLLVSLDDQDDVIDTLGGEEFETPGGADSLDPFAFLATTTSGSLQPGIRYLFLSEGRLQSENVTANGNIELTVFIPSPDSALLALMGLAVLGLRRSLSR